ncbi:MAG: hypothetical protein HQK54_08505, partial [Oligoflexales bacterium]|nr:hypothetical protein [Oligoflexales bacterium]
MGLSLVLTSAAFFAISGIPSFLLNNRGFVSRYFSVMCAISGALLGIAGIVLGFSSNDSAFLEFAWSIPAGRF